MAIRRLLVVCTSLFFTEVKCVFGSSVSTTLNVPAPTPYPVGDVRRCLAQMNKSVQRFEVLPGGGWDNLQNKEMGQVSFMNYSLCKTTDDGKFLVPDAVYTIPVKSSRVETYAELIEHWSNYTCVTSRSINAHAGLSLAHFGISGSFSSEYQHVKSQQYFDQSVTSRIQVRYVRYQAKLEPDTPYLAVFRDRLRKIAAHATLNKTQLATYESQLLVRDFGTHLITSVDVGAALVQLDQVRGEYVRNYDSRLSTVKAAASASFFQVFSIGGSYSQSTSVTEVKSYKGNRTASHIDTIGGPIFKPMNYTAGAWSESIDNNMVALDRAGDPLYFSINEQTLPDLPVDTIFQVYKYVRAAVDAYYKHNIYRGCTNPDSPNFVFEANVDDGTCSPPETNYTFGGVYQQCTGYPDLCKNLVQKNPRTGGYSCSEGYEAVELQTGTKYTQVRRRSCHGCWLFFTCCHDYTDNYSAQYTAYWCAAKGPVPANNGFLFGGLYTTMLNNPLTMSKTCPQQYYSLRILDNLFVCISDDYELGFRYSLPFAGFFSCISGNPLALKRDNKDLLRSDGTHSLMSFMLESGPSSYPRECPSGYSQHLAVIYKSCEVNYCVKYGSLSPLSLPRVQRPPFMEAPASGYAQSDTDSSSFVFSDDGGVWMTMSEAEQKFGNQQASDDIPAQDSDPSSKSSVGLSSGGVAAISICSTLLFIILMALVVLGVKRRKSKGKVYKETDPWYESEHVTRRRGLFPRYDGGYSHMENPASAVTQT